MNWIKKLFHMHIYTYETVMEQRRNLKGTFQRKEPHRHRRCRCGKEQVFDDYLTQEWIDI